MAAECARNALLQKVVDNKENSGEYCVYVCKEFFNFYQSLLFYLH